MKAIFLFWRRLALQRDALLALQLAHSALEHHAPAPAHCGGIEPHQIQNGGHAALNELVTGMPADSPHFTHCGGLQHCLKVTRRQRSQVAHPGQLGGIAARLPVGTLDDVIVQLCQRFGERNANTGGDACPLKDALPHAAGAVGTSPWTPDMSINDSSML